ncbi:hypothetical protein BKI52_24280 [marine bacterium AO1-C]|nr:hypothetical protein BKI52_24280 [marine bacterium AO1-C]
MRKIKVIWVVVLASLVFSACVSNNKTEKPARKRYCANAYMLFTAPDSVTKISTQGDSSSVKFGIALQDSLQSDLCDTLINFGIQLSPQFAVSAWIEKDCKIIRCFPMGPKVKVWETPGKILALNLEYIGRDSIPWDIFKALSAKTTQYDQLRSSLRWSIPFSSGGLSKMIYQILDGYLLAYNQLAQKHYQKSFCDLTVEQVAYLKKELPFALFIAIDELPTLPTSFPPVNIDSLLEVDPEIPEDSLPSLDWEVETDND